MGVMPRPPTEFEIGPIEVTTVPPSRPVRVGNTQVVPSHFRARIELLRPSLTVVLHVEMGNPGNHPAVTHLAVEADRGHSITTPLLRRVLVDRLMRAAVTKAITPAEVDPPAAPQLPAQAGNDRIAAELYEEALTLGKHAPAEFAADKMGVSRSTVARYLRKAREDGLLAGRAASIDLHGPRLT